MSPINTKVGSLPLIKRFFGMTMAEVKTETKDLSIKDRTELGSVIARHFEKSQDELNFTLVEY